MLLRLSWHIHSSTVLIAASEAVCSIVTNEWLESVVIDDCTIYLQLSQVKLGTCHFAFTDYEK